MMAVPLPTLVPVRWLESVATGGRSATQCLGAGVPARGWGSYLGSATGDDDDDTAERPLDDDDANTTRRGDAGTRPLTPRGHGQPAGLRAPSTESDRVRHQPATIV